jgi:hypothetical protein
MKVYFANNSDLQMKPINAWVATAEEGASILAGLATYCDGDPVIMRARIKHKSNSEIRFIGTAASHASDKFIEDVRIMGT